MKFLSFFLNTAYFRQIRPRTMAAKRDSAARGSAVRGGLDVSAPTEDEREDARGGNGRGDRRARQGTVRRREEEHLLGHGTVAGPTHRPARAQRPHGLGLPRETNPRSAATRGHGK